jgi:hypothetical protein
MITRTESTKAAYVFAVCDGQIRELIASYPLRVSIVDLTTGKTVKLAASKLA